MILGILEQGLIYGILALGLLITYRILDFPDLTVDSSFPLGAAVSAVLTVHGMHPVLTLFFGLLAGALAGLVTGLIHAKCHVRDLLSSIITMTGLYSVNLYIAGLSGVTFTGLSSLAQVTGKASVPLFTYDTLFRNPLTKSAPAAIAPSTTLIIVFLIALIAKLIMDWFLRTKAGYLLIAAGDNPAVVTTLAKDQGKVKILGLVLANALVALSGAVMCQSSRNFDISMGTGSMVIGLASVIIGTNLFRNVRFMKSTTMVIIGSILYKACVSLAMKVGLDAFWMKFITAVLFLIILVASQMPRKKVHIRA